MKRPMPLRDRLGCTVCLGISLGGMLCLATPDLASTEPMQVSQAVSQWSRFSSIEGRFTVLMRGKPIERTQPQDTPMGRIEMRTFSVEVPGEAAYLITYTDFPASFVNNANPNQLLDVGRDEVLKRVRGTLRREQTISLNGAPGREIQIEVPGDLVIHNRIFLVNQRVYQVIVVTPRSKEQFLTRSIAGFFESFKVLPQS